MKIYGADFSGARNPSRGIYYASGSIESGTLFIDKVVHCDDRLDLLAAIHFTKAPWGLDFPFSIANEALNCLQVTSWEDLLPLILKYERKGYDHFITDSGIPDCESKCQGHSTCCRVVDASIHSFSPLKRTNPNMRMMTYAGLKLLLYLRSLGNVVYPFDKLDKGVSRLYEVYPSHTWRQVGLRRKTATLETFIEKFTDKYGFKLDIEESLLNVKSLDAVDAVVACVTMAFALVQYTLEADWNKHHPWISAVEWDYRYKEGLIVKVH